MKDGNILTKIPSFGKTVLRKYGILLILVVVLAIASFLSPHFLSQTNIINLIRQVAVIAIIACGATMVFISGMVDLSPGSVLALAGIFGTDVMVRTGSVFLAITVGVTVGALAGYINGFLIAKFNIPPFIATLAMMQAARGFVYLYTNLIPVTGIGRLVFLGQGYIWKIPLPIVVLMIIVLITWVILKFSKFGRRMFAMGCNPEAARAAGINVYRMKILVFVVNGMIVGLAGMVLMARMNSGQPYAGIGYEFDAITAVIIGGTSLYGGVGSVQGSLVGALIIGILNNILNLLNVAPFYQEILKGVLIAGAVIMDVKTKKYKL